MIMKMTPVTDFKVHYNDVIMEATSSQITSLTIVFSTVYSDTDQREHIKAPRHWLLCGEFTEMFPFHDVIMYEQILFV